MFGEYQSSEPSRFIDEVPPELLERAAPAYSGSSYQGNFPHYEFRTNPYGARPQPLPGTGAGAKPYAYEDEDQTTGHGSQAGVRVRHPQFGIGNVISVEALDDDTKLVVRFSASGVKTLRAKYARLEPA